MVHQGTQLITPSIYITSKNDTDETAIGLPATTNSEYVTGITNSRVAFRNYKLGCISPFALKILKTIPQLLDIYIGWTSRHYPLDGNEAAHAAARVHTFRAIFEESQYQEMILHTLNGYADSLTHFRHECKRFHPPPSNLLWARALWWLQTNSYPHSALLFHIYPNQYIPPATFAPSLAPCIVWCGNSNNPNSWHPIPGGSPVQLWPLCPAHAQREGTKSQQGPGHPKLVDTPHRAGALTILHLWTAITNVYSLCLL